MEKRNEGLLLGGVSVRELITRFGSPLYVYEEDTIRRWADELRDAIVYEPREIKYACKANTNIEIMKILREEGLGIDAVSPGEIYAALKAGFEPEQILFTSNNATWEEIEYAVSKNVMVNIDSLSFLRRFGKEFPGKEICVRINPNVGAGHHNHVITGGPESKFGIHYSKIPGVTEIAGEAGLKIAGIHQHIGSGILDPDMFIKAMDVLLEVAVLVKNLSFIDFGGGIGVPYRENEQRVDVGILGKKITEDFRSFCRSYGKQLKLIIEPGRYIIAESGFLLATVTSVKEGDRHRFVGIDTGFNHLLRPAMYGSYHEILHADNPNDEKRPQTIAGYLCESGDTFTRDDNGIVDRALPLFNEGDIVCICNAGAYGFSMSSHYNSRPRPAEVLVRDKKARLIRRRETLEDIFNLQL
jgi:diaminopimelate decarboxylase